MPRALRYDIPGVDRRVAFERVRAAGWREVFAGDVADPLPLVVEIGYGRGEFLIDLAERQPQCAFLGVERSFKRTLKMARRLARAELANIRLLGAPAQPVVSELLAPETVSCFWINFPDPWPKKRHRERRLLTPAFVHELARRLVPGGELHIATDHADYAAAIDAVLSDEARLENLWAPEPLRRENPGRPFTAYELEWRAKGRPFHFFAYRRPASTPGGAGEGGS